MSVEVGRGYLDQVGRAPDLCPSTSSIPGAVGWPYSVGAKVVFPSLPMGCVTAVAWHGP
jgi:hypothetical protein